MSREKEKTYAITRVLNHNVVLVEEPGSGQEIVLFGKGIGFGAKPGNTIPSHDLRVEKRFRLENENHQKQYQNILSQVDPAVVGIAEEIIALIASEITPELNEHVHVALPDHIQFAIYRLNNGMEIVNPFLFEIQTLYTKEYALANRAADMIKNAFDLDIPDSEIGFLALHIHSAISYVPVKKAVQFTNIITELVSLIEERTAITIERSTIDYVRLITHLRFAVERIRQQKFIKNPLLDRVKTTMPEAYQLATELAQYISTRLEIAVPEDEVGYMALHLYRLLQQN
ncbi:PRD domain-containing protein [Brevibacillus sp. HB1.3]|uniref:glucose PTS transporter transcription antiterminator GlcT n=1 Tax=Brevibacillus TaxID=55080 RepID=UPI0015567A9F|nr:MULTISPECIES: PRD domain-containing protein [Brevibacillus]NQF17496.1 PRD domain-containing protein [Brevibacillus sp. HB1.3]